MNEPTERAPRIKSALFVDFDNIYVGLRKIEPAAAERFATEPARWLHWIEQGLPGEDDNGHPLEQRSVLIRRCYLNPRSFSQYRPYFTRSAFSVIDCPPVTAQGKNSADIHMVMDVLDTLEHQTRFDEFIVLSGDSDFAPVLLRLRAHDRRTVIFAIGPAAEAYKAACDRVVTEDDLIEALALPDDTGPAIAKTEKEHPRARARVKSKLPPKKEEGTSAMQAAIIEEVARIVGNANGPVLLANAAHEVRKALGPTVTQTHWGGAGTFQKLLLGVTDARFAMKTSPPPAYLYDPTRHQLPPTEAQEEKPEELPAHLADFARRVNQLSSAPLLPPEKYTLVFDALAEDLKKNRYHLTSTSKAVRDRCLEKGSAVSRRNVLTILDGIRYAGYRYHQDGDGADHLRAAFRQGILAVCNDAQLEMSEAELKLLDEWIGGAARAAASTPPAADEVFGTFVEEPIAPKKSARPRRTPRAKSAPSSPTRAEKPAVTKRDSPGTRSRTVEAEALLHSALEAAAKQPPAAKKTTRSRSRR